MAANGEKVYLLNNKIIYSMKYEKGFSPLTVVQDVLLLNVKQKDNFIRCTNSKREQTS